MMRTGLAGPVVAVLCVVVLAGCQQPEIDMAEMMKPPPRPTELDRLEMFVGQWEGTGEMKMPGGDQSMTCSGVETVSWDADKWLLLSRYEYSMGDAGTMTGVGVWTWDPKARKYRMWSFDNYGRVGTATATYDEATQTWCMKSKTHDSVSGQTSVGEGTVKCVDADTQKWSWSEWDAWKFRKFMEMDGTSRRKP